MYFICYDRFLCYALLSQTLIRAQIVQYHTPPTPSNKFYLSPYIKSIDQNTASSVTSQEDRKWELLHTYLLIVSLRLLHGGMEGLKTCI